jgi:hypothetical protein
VQHTVEPFEQTLYSIELIVFRALAQGHAVAVYAFPNRTRSGALGLEVFDTVTGDTVSYWEFDGDASFIASLAQFADDLAYRVLPQNPPVAGEDDLWA